MGSRKLSQEFSSPPDSNARRSQRLVEGFYRGKRSAEMKFASSPSCRKLLDAERRQPRPNNAIDIRTGCERIGGFEASLSVEGLVASGVGNCSQAAEPS